jgi:Ser/Thr protein kinase RdoA (MazF antagonist)
MSTPARFVPVELALRSGAPKRHCVRVLEFIPGEMMNEQHVTPALLREAGGYLGRLDAALDGFDAPGFHRDHAWDIRNTLGLRTVRRAALGRFKRP